MRQSSDAPNLRVAIGTPLGVQVARQLALALNAQSIYGALHPSVLCAADDIARLISLLPSEDAAVTIAMGGRAILADGLELSLPPAHVENLRRCSRAHRIGRIVIRRGLEALELAAFLSLLLQMPEDAGEHDDLAARLLAQGIAHISLKESEALDLTDPENPCVDTSLLQTSSTALEVIQESAQQARVGGVINAAAARALATELADSVIEDRARLLGLLSMHRRDEYTFQHSLNVCLLALSLGIAVGLTRNRLQDLGLAALLHDVGKVWVPLEVLRKPGKLDETELDLMRQHPVAGASYLSEQPELPPVAALVAFGHHLRYDQRGYPELRWPTPADPYSLIVGLVDAYEALTSDRPYRPTRTSDEALQVMRSTGAGQFEPRLLEVFGEVIRGSRRPSAGDRSVGEPKPAPGGRSESPTVAESAVLAEEQ